MPDAEKKLLTWIDRHRFMLYVIILSVLGLLARMGGLDFVSNDATEYLLVWFGQIRESGGLAALGSQVGNYNIPYQILISLMTYLPFEPLYMYKALSILFDYLLAGSAAGFCYDLTQKNTERAVLVYGVVLLLPTVILNSSVWGQCDSIYVTFVICAVWSLMNERYTRSFLLLGAAFAFKLQAVFIFPFFLMYYILEKRFSILNFVWVVVVDYALCIPAFLMGEEPSCPGEHLPVPVRAVLQHVFEISEFLGVGGR